MSGFEDSTLIENISKIGQMIITKTIPPNKCHIFSKTLRQFDHESKKIFKPQINAYHQERKIGNIETANKIDQNIWDDMSLGLGLGSILISYGEILNCITDQCKEQCTMNSILGLSEVKTDEYCFCDNKFKKDRMFDVAKYNGGFVRMQGSDAMIFEYFNSLK
jgi:hypothetical protein